SSIRLSDVPPPPPPPLALQPASARARPIPERKGEARRLVLRAVISNVPFEEGPRSKSNAIAAGGDCSSEIPDWGRRPDETDSHRDRARRADCTERRLEGPKGASDLRVVKRESNANAA